MAKDVSPTHISKPRLYRPALWGAFLTAMIVATGSLAPFRFREAYGDILTQPLVLWGVRYVTPHTVIHILSFGLLGGLTWSITERWLPRILYLGAVLALGLAIELLQVHIHPSNGLETWDLRDDSVGAGLGVLSAFFVSSIRRRPRVALTR